MIRISLFAIGLIAATAAQAGELRANSGKSFELAGATGSVYYTAEANGYRVVATVMSAGGQAPLRFVTMLGDGQSVSLDVAGAVNEAPLEMKIQRVGDVVDVSLPQTPIYAADSELDTVQTGTVN